MRNEGDPEVLIDTAEYDEMGNPRAVKLRKTDANGNTAEVRTAEEKYLKAVPKRGESSNPLMRGINSIASSVGSGANAFGDAVLADPAAPPVKVATDIPVAAPIQMAPIDPTAPPMMSLDAQNAPLAPLPTVNPMAGLPTAAPEASPQIPLSHNLMEEQGGAPLAAPVKDPAAYAPPTAGSGRSGVVDLDSSKTTSATYNPALQSVADAAHTDFHNALSKVAKAEGAKADVQALGAQAEAASIGDFLAKESARRSVEADKVAMKEKDYQAEVDKMAGMKLTTPHMFYGQSTSNQIIAGIAVSLGALGQALGQPGTKNMGIESIQATIDRDIAQQKYNIDNQKDIANAKRTMYQDLVKKYGDERAARAAYQEMVMAQVSKEFESRALATNNPIIKAKAEQSAAEADGKVAEARLERSKVLHETMTDQKPAAAGERAKPVYVEQAEHDKLQARKEFVSGIREAEALYSNPKYTKYAGLINSTIEEVKAKFGGTVPQEYIDLRERSMALQQHLQMVTTGMGVNKTELDNLQKQIGQVFEDPKNAASKLNALDKVHTESTANYARGLNSRYLGHPDVFNYTKSMLADVEAKPTPPGTPLARK